MQGLCLLASSAGLSAIAFAKGICISIKFDLGKRLSLRSRLNCRDAAAIHVCGIPVPADHLLLRCEAAAYKVLLS